VVKVGEGEEDGLGLGGRLGDTVGDADGVGQLQVGAGVGTGGLKEGKGTSVARGG
jgi:hypothetical protein